MFWLIAVLGLIDIGFLDVVDIDGGILDMDGDGSTVPDGIAGFILNLGLNGVPLTIVITLVSLFGWFVSYYLVYFSTGYVPEGLFTWLAHIGFFVVSLYIGIKLTSVTIRPLRPLFRKMQKHTQKIIIGQTAIVRTSRVDEDFGEAVLDDGGAGLILKVRSIKGERFSKNDRVVLFEYIEDINAYRVMSEKEFLQ